MAPLGVQADQPVWDSQKAGPIDSTTSPTIFGNIKAANVNRDVRAVEIMRLTKRYADFLQVTFLGYQRADGLVVIAGCRAGQS